MPHDSPDADLWKLHECRRVGQRIREERIHRNLTQEHVYLAVPLNRSHYQAIEAGEANPSLDVLLRICRVLGVRLDLVR